MILSLAISLKVMRCLTFLVLFLSASGLLVAAQETSTTTRTPDIQRPNPSPSSTNLNDLLSSVVVLETVPVERSSRIQNVTATVPAATNNHTSEGSYQQKIIQNQESQNATTGIVLAASNDHHSGHQVSSAHQVVLDRNSSDHSVVSNQSAQERGFRIISTDHYLTSQNQPQNVTIADLIVEDIVVVLDRQNTSTSSKLISGNSPNLQERISDQSDLFSVLDQPAILKNSSLDQLELNRALQNTTGDEVGQKQHQGSHDLDLQFRKKSGVVEASSAVPPIGDHDHDRLYNPLKPPPILVRSNQSQIRSDQTMATQVIRDSASTSASLFQGSLTTTQPQIIRESSTSLPSTIKVSATTSVPMIRGSSTISSPTIQESPTTLPNSIQGSLNSSKPEPAEPESVSPKPLKPYDLPVPDPGSFRRNYSEKISQIISAQINQGQTRSEPKQDRTKSARRFHLVEIKSGVHWLDTPSPHSKILKLDHLFSDPGSDLKADPGSSGVQLDLHRLDEAQWRSDFLQLSHYMITNTDRLGFFKVSLEQIFNQDHGSHSHHLPPNINYHQLMSNHTELYYSERNSSVLLISRLGAYIEIYGLINDRLMITPIWRQSTSVLKEGWHLPNGFNRMEELNQFYTDNHSRTLLHAVIDNRDSIAKHMGFDISQVLEQIKAHLASHQQRRNLPVDPHLPPPPPGAPEPETLYPEVSLLIDYWAYQAHGRNIGELWRYLVIYFTRLDMIYRQMSKPAIRMRLSNIYVATQPFRFQLVQPRLKFNPVSAQGQHRHRPYLNALKAINELGVYFHLEAATFARQADLMLVITGEDLCLDHADSGWASSASAFDSCSYTTNKGQSFVGGACRTDPSGRKNLNVAVVEDTGYFDGVLVAAHELGHLMGAVHDGEWPIRGILGPGGRGCTSSRGFLMSTGTRALIPTHQNQFRWSNCTAEQLDYFARLPQAVCLYNRPPF